jgi:hypothetical protein
MQIVSSPSPSVAAIAVTPAQPAPGHLLCELERRQDDVLRQLDELESQLNQVLTGLGVAMIDCEPSETETSQAGESELE